MQEKWGSHVFNSNHPAYTADLWTNIVNSVKLITANFTGVLTGFDKSIIKRQIYHMMFLEESPNDPLETIAYNDHEYLNEYEGLQGAYLRFINSGAPKSSNMTFNEFLKLPAWFCDWLVEWHSKQSLSESNDQKNQLNDLEKSLAATTKGKKDNFQTNGY